MVRRVKVIAHRGVHEKLPENTLEAYEAAISIGCDYIEVDLRTAANGKLVIKHNPLTEGEQLPLFDDVLKLAKGRIGIYLDVKAALPAAIVAAVEQHDMRGSLLTYGGFQLLRDLFRLRPGWPCMPEATNPELLKAHLAMLRPPAVAFSDWDFTPELVKMTRDAGCQVFLDRQGETDTPEHWQAAIRAGATGIQTDRPAALLEWLDRQW